jgi:hypothetical protein
MSLFNGMIINDKFCMIRQAQVKLRWSRSPYRFRPRISDYAPDDRRQKESSHETPLADTAPIPTNSGRGTAMGSSVPKSPPMDDTSRALHHIHSITPISDGGHA